MLFSSDDIDDISNKERELQALFGYHIDHRPYKQTVDRSVAPEPVNATAYSTTFPCPLSELPEYLKSIAGHSWETPYGVITLTDEVAK
ncbi:MAG: hypothetical protein OEV79_12075, partial [candidate division WOR-3 bacterium]|nr:hypothetical protein [candidate division WOR-3 bacterium]